MGARRKSIEPMDTLEQVVEAAFHVFKTDKPTKIGVCENCCMYAKVEADFFNPDIRDLPDHYLQDWFFAAADIPLAKNIWAYLLPRVLEMLVAGKEPATVGIEVSLSRFPTGVPDNWNDDQWRVLDRFHQLFLDRQKTNSDDFLDDIFCMFGNAGFSNTRSIAIVSAWSDEELTLKLWQDCCAQGTHGIWGSTFWDNGTGQDVYDWHRSSALYERLTNYALRDDTPPELVQKASDVTAVILQGGRWT